MSYSVLVTGEAEEDLRELVHYIALGLENPVAARALVALIEDNITSFSEFPYRLALVNDSILSTYGIRFSKVKNYYIFVRIDEINKQVQILRILYARRDWASIISPEILG